MNKITKAYLEGLIEGRFSQSSPKCPHQRTQSRNQWAAGLKRGMVLRHFADETTPNNKELTDEVLKCRRAHGEKV